jgi:pseudaminic acid cytidylyltransferase
VEDNLMKNVALIPARAGSKRIPGKNIKPFAGQPIIAYSIKAAEASGLFSRIIVSTDSAEIAAVARSYGAQTPFMRPSGLADDFTPTADVVLHALNWLKANESLPEYFCCIYATAPFLQPQYLQTGLELLRDKADASTAFSVTSFAYPIFRALDLDENNRLKMIWPEHLETRSNDLPEAYHDAGQFYWGRSRQFLTEKSLLSKNAVPVILPRYLVQDIDTPEDWKTAEYMYNAMKINGPEPNE